MDSSAASASSAHELDARRLQAAMSLLEMAVAPDMIPGAATAVFHRGRLVASAALGRRDPDHERPPVQDDTLFLIASLTKTIVCASAMLLVQDGRLCLDDTVASFVPAFGQPGKEGITIRHLMTHTSGLPDQLPESRALRRSQAPVEEFVAATCATPLLFAPGTRVSYQSMGILMLAQVVEVVTGSRIRDHLRTGLFEPLGMTDSTLGLPPSGMERTALSLPAVFAPNSTDVGDDWNTPYWRDFGCPWGGLHSTVGDLGRFLMHMLGDLPGPLCPAARRAMVRSQLPAHIRAAGTPDGDWGLGFGIAKPQFGDLVSPRTFGHLGATGAMFWADPETHLALVVLTNQPAVLRNPDKRYANLLPRLSNAVAAALGPA